MMPRQLEGFPGLLWSDPSRLQIASVGYPEELSVVRYRRRSHWLPSSLQHQATFMSLLLLLLVLPKRHAMSSA